MLKLNEEFCLFEEINVAPLVIQMTRRFSQMLMAFLFPNKNHQQQQPEVPNANKSAVKHSSTPVHKRRTKSAEVRRL